MISSFVVWSMIIIEKQDLCISKDWSVAPLARIINLNICCFSASHLAPIVSAHRKMFRKSSLQAMAFRIV